MGTRSLTKIIEVYQDEKKTSRQVLTTMYRQMDGYMEGHGAELAEWLAGFTVANGLGMDEARKVANGANCLAAQMFQHFKDGPGNIYLYPPGARNCGEEYIYYIYVDGSEINVWVKDTCYNKYIFKGTTKEFLTKTQELCQE
tara:strand:- start:1274 stop:1699 length:426 start_codon:yes stop_codon:yes gene_type:complete